VNVQTPDKETEERDQREFDEAVDHTGKTVLEWLAGAGKPAATQGAATAPAVTAPARTESLKIVGGAKLGPDGKKHDEFTKTEFAVKVGQPLKLKIDNTDDVPHSITAPVVGINLMIRPGVHTYTLVVTQAGKFQWFCIIPCDSDAGGWAMSHPGFMAGYITAT
jgi:heme/copper-type cytochrome/quinol oxidase subunit 2